MKTCFESLFFKEEYGFSTFLFDLVKDEFGLKYDFAFETCYE